MRRGTIHTRWSPKEDGSPTARLQGRATGREPHGEHTAWRIVDYRWSLYHQLLSMRKSHQNFMKRGRRRGPPVGWKEACRAVQEEEPEKTCRMEKLHQPSSHLTIIHEEEVLLPGRLVTGWEEELPSMKKLHRSIVHKEERRDAVEKGGDRWWSCNPWEKPERRRTGTARPVA